MPTLDEVYRVANLITLFIVQCGYSGIARTTWQIARGDA